MSASITNVMIPLVADSVEELIKLQVENNAINNIHYNYTTPIFADGKWYIWFFVDLKSWNNPSDLDNETIQMIKGGF